MLIGTAILSIGIFNGVMLSILLWIKRKDRFLAFGIFVYSFLLLKYLGYWVGYFPSHVVLAQLLRPLELLMGPIMLGAIFRLGGWKLRNEWVHYMPFLLLFVAISTYCIAQQNYLGHVLPFFPRPTMVAKLTHEILYLLAIPLLRRPLSKPMLLIVTFYVLQWVLSICYSMFRFSSPEMVNIFLFAGMVFSINYLAFIALQSSSVFRQVARSTTPTTTKKEVNLLPTFDRITDYIVQQELYLNRNVKIADLAKELKISEKIISKAVNAKSGENFNMYLNRFRVAHAAKLMGDSAYSHFTIDAIGLESGFSNKVSFYKAFKRVHLMSPSAWKKKNITDQVD